jgi:microcystin-dependent protein
MAIKAGSTIAASDFTGMIWPSILRSVPDQWLLCDGSAKSRLTYSALYALVCPSSTVTITIASPGVVTWTGHPLENGDVIVFTTSGALPTGITSGQQYFVISATTNTFEIALSRGGSAINTTGSQSGTQTAQCFTFGIGDGSTTFNIPNLAGRMIVGASGSAGTRTLLLPPVAISGNAITINNAADFPQGMAVTYAGSSITGLSAGTYYVIAVSSTTIKLASTQANANSATAVSISGTPTTDTLTYTTTQRILGDMGGEEKHGISQAELASHVHPGVSTSTFAAPQGSGGSAGTPTTGNTGSAGGDTQHNTMPPFASLNYFIHI